ncbi:MAG: molecular chaperone DnaJ, partial [Haloarculaceae archaeon]
MTETYYDRLGVDPDAATGEIEQAYRDRLKETHPDVSDEEDASERTRAIIEAKDVLTDEDKRARYDRLGHEQYVNQQMDAAPGTASEATPSTDGATDASSSSGRAGEETGTDAENGAGDDNEGQSGVWTGGERTRGGGYGHGNGDGATAETTWSETQRAARDSWSDEGRDTRTQSGTSEEKTWRAWDTDASYSLSQDGLQQSRLFVSSQSLVLLASTFFLYPLLLWATLSPSFPLGVNVAVGVCLVGVITYLQSIPEVGIVVFGTWAVLLM